MAYEANRRVETSVRTFAIIERLSHLDRAGVSEISADLGMSKGIIHNHLSTLRELGYVTKTGDSYELSPKLLSLGVRTRSESALYQNANAPLREFADRLDLGAVLIQSAGSDCCVVETYHLPPGTGLETGTILSNSLVGLVLDLQRNCRPEHTTYDVSTVAESLEREGFAIGSVASDVDRQCVAVPIVDDDDRCYGGVMVLLPDTGSPDPITDEAVRLRRRIENRFTSGWADERSFATEKHSWVDG